MLMFSIPFIAQILLLPFWFLSYYTSCVATLISIISPIYLIIVNLTNKYSTEYGYIKIHLLMTMYICITEFISYLGWSKFSVKQFLNPDAMTVALSIGEAKFGLYIIAISFILFSISKIIKCAPRA